MEAWTLLGRFVAAAFRTRPASNRVLRGSLERELHPSVSLKPTQGSEVELRSFVTALAFDKLNKKQNRSVWDRGRVWALGCKVSARHALKRLIAEVLEQPCIDPLEHTCSLLSLQP